MPKWSIKFVTDKRDDNFTCSGTVSDCDKPGEAPYGLAADIQNMFYYHGQRNYVSLAFTCICMSVEFSEKTASLFFLQKKPLWFYMRTKQSRPIVVLCLYPSREIIFLFFFDQTNGCMCSCISPGTAWASTHTRYSMDRCCSMADKIWAWIRFLSLINISKTVTFFWNWINDNIG